jgi:uncharacterized protein
MTLDQTTVDLTGAIDCDVHPLAPTPEQLAPYMDDYWRETLTVRGIDSWETIAYPPHAPLTIRADWRAASPRADSSPAALAQALLDPLKLGHAILNCLFPVQAFRDARLAAAFARAVNDWLVAEWLDKDARLRASIVVAPQDPTLAVAEIERRAGDRRFVQVLLLAMGEAPLGHVRYWPIHEAAERHGLTIGIHAGSSYHHAVTGSGWPSHYIEDYAAQSAGFHTQLGSLLSEGVFVKFPKLKAVLIESGVTWMPAYMWRFAKFWRGVRLEVPWIDREPLDIVREHIRFTLTPFDAPAEAAIVSRIAVQLGSDDLLLFSSDFPHAQFSGNRIMPAGLPEAMLRKCLRETPLATYARLR